MRLPPPCGGARDEIEDLLMRSLAALSAVSYKEDTVRTALAAGTSCCAPPTAWPPSPSTCQDRPAGRGRLAKATKKKETTPSHEFFDLAQRLLELRAQATQAYAFQRLALLRAMLEQGSAAQRDAKRRQRVIAFDDMLFNLYDRLNDGASPWLAGALKARSRRR